ncbi:TonB-dependent receptor [Sphingosinicella microcystinivorans]|uniref:TonB-dependent receptor n=1 Tax=Sphingosinicella microcystinivorans TaxID=335406 RepID=UPI0022F3D529|nr:TonB-dependent receptor [Sphingosinicella microcystinivorans]WBX86151.1 TonB-dependent receptor [Sphingosinicella microcystinivorans]
MIDRTRALLLGTLSLAALVGPVAGGYAAANAQEASGERETAGTLAAVDKIVVTATKRAEASTIYETPIAVSAFGARQLEDAHVGSLSDLTTMIPNVVLNGTAVVPGLNNFSIRGMGVYSSIPSTTPTVGVFIDGVYVGANAGTVLDNVFDLEGIEVLRGPQGLLFGRNVTAGAVLVRTTEPKDDLYIRAQAGIESGPNYTFSTVISGPLTENGALSAKIAGYYNHDRGYFHNLGDGNKNFGRSTTGIVRAAVSWRASENFRHVLRFEDGSLRSDGPAGQDHAVYSTKSLKFAIDETGFNNIDWQNATLESRLDVGFGDGQVVNIFGWRDVNARSLTDVDASVLTNFHVGEFVKQHQFSNELRYSGTFGIIDATVGAFYYWDKLKYVETRDLALGTVFRIGGGEQTSSTWAIFSNFDIHLMDALTLNLGARYSAEDKEASVRALAAASPCSVVSNSCSSFNFNDSADWSAFTPKIGVQWNPSDSSHLYAYWTKGFRSGGFNLRQTNPLAPPGPYDQEVENTYEVGWKQKAFGNRLQFGVAAFRNIYKKLQRDVLFTDPLLGAVQTTLNTADVTINGVELEATVRPTESLTLQANAGYLDSKIDKLRRALSPTGIITPDQYRLELPFLAEWSYGGSIRYERSVGTGLLSASVSYQHVDSSFSEDLNNRPLNPINNVDADLTYTFGGTGVTASLYGKNLLDKTTFGLNTLLPFAPDQTFSPLNKGRILGIELRYRH